MIASVPKNVGMALIVALLVLAGWVLQDKAKPFRMGLDISGGVRFLLEAQPTPETPQITPEVMETLHGVLDKRINPTGSEENLVQKVGDTRILIEIPGTSDLESARQVIGITGKLEFKALDPATGQYINTGLTGAELSGSGLSKSTQTNGWEVNLEFNDKGTKLFTEITKKLSPYRGQLGIFFDDKLQSSPQVNDTIATGQASITGNFSKQTAQNMVDILKAGALPVNIKIIQESTVGPLLGKASLDKSIQGGLIGLALVVAFMLLYYRVPGIYANLALILYTLLLLTAIKLSPASLSLSGIAGIILSIGMAVDANILIFERTKEEIISGKDPKKAIELGFERALPSIFDSNLTTILSCGILYYFGTGLVKGFAFNLVLGVALSFFTALFVSRTLMQTFPLEGNTSFMFGIPKKDLPEPSPSA